jgi:hypothetical protein
MPREIVTTKSAPGSPLFSQGVKAGPPARYVAKLGAEPPGVLVSIRMAAFVG